MIWHSRMPRSLSGVLFAMAGLVWGQQTSLRLGPELAARLGVDVVPLVVGEGAEVGVLQGRQAIRLPSRGVAAAFRIPVTAWSGQEGTVQFWLRTARRIGHRPGDDPPLSVALMSCPGFRLELQQQRDCPWLVAFPGADATRPRAICRIAYLLAERWYHVAITWQQSTGTVDVFINGWAQQHFSLEPWESSVPDDDVRVVLGNVAGNSVEAEFLAIADPHLQAWAMNEPQIRGLLGEQDVRDVEWGVRSRRHEPMDLTGYRFERLYRADFAEPLPMIAESDLFEGGKRVRMPEQGQWVLEGNAKISTGDGTLLIDNLDSETRNHVVLWLPEPFPADILAAFEFMPQVADRGLAIVFFAARPRADPQGSIFDLDLPRREGDFRNYIRGEVDSYHVSYAAAGQLTSFIPGPRRTANIRKNSGFWLIACGDDQIHGQGYERRWHRVRILKVGGKIRVEANGRLSAAVDDDGQTWGPVLQDGYIGLRQMNHLLSGRYRNLAVERVTRRP